MSKVDALQVAAPLDDEYVLTAVRRAQNAANPRGRAVTRRQIREWMFDHKTVADVFLDEIFARLLARRKLHVLSGLYWVSVVVALLLLGCGPGFERSPAVASGGGAAPTSAVVAAGGGSAPTSAVVVSGGGAAPTSAVVAAGGGAAPTSAVVAAGVGAAPTSAVVAAGVGAAPTSAVVVWPACLVIGCGACVRLDLKSSEPACYAFVSCMLSHQCGPLDACARPGGPCDSRAAEGLACQCSS